MSGQKNCGLQLVVTRQQRTIVYATGDSIGATTVAAGLVVGFNVLNFDYEVLRAYTDDPLDDIPTVDMLDHIYKRLGFRVSLDKLAASTLGTSKSADGLQAVRWYKQGRMQEILDYCQQDVEVTRHRRHTGACPHAPTPARMQPWMCSARASGPAPSQRRTTRSSPGPSPEGRATGAFARHVVADNRPGRSKAPTRG